MKGKKLVKLDLLRRKINEHFTANPKAKSATFKIEADESKTHWRVIRKKSQFNIVEVKSERREFIIEKPAARHWEDQAKTTGLDQAVAQAVMQQPPPPAPMPPALPPAPVAPQQPVGAPMAPVGAAPLPQVPPMPMPMAAPPSVPLAPPAPISAPLEPQLPPPPPPPPVPVVPEPPAPQQEPMMPPADAAVDAADLANLPPVSGDPGDWAPDNPSGRFAAEVYAKGLAGAQQAMPPEQLQQHFGIDRSALKGGTHPTPDPLENPAIVPGDVKLDHNLHLSHKKNNGRVLKEEDAPFQPGTSEEAALTRGLKGQVIKDVSVLTDKDHVKVELKLATTDWPASFEMNKDGKLIFIFKDRRYILHKKWS